MKIKNLKTEAIILILFFFNALLLASCSRSHSSDTSLLTYSSECGNSSKGNEIKSQRIQFSDLGDGYINEVLSYFKSLDCKGEYLNIIRYLKIVNVAGSLEDSFSEKKEATFTSNIHSDASFMLLIGNMNSVKDLDFLVACEYNSDGNEYPVK
jgi:hypothetical protein